MTIDRKPLKDHLEAVGHRDAFLYIEEIAQNKQQTHRNGDKKHPFPSFNKSPGG